MEMLFLFMMIGITFLGALGAALLKIGSKKIDKKWKSFILNSKLIEGLLLYAGATILYIFLLSKTELSILYPLTALSYVWVLIISRIQLNEKITAYKMIGISMIMVGIFIINLK